MIKEEVSFKIGINDKVPLKKSILLAFQHMAVYVGSFSIPIIIGGSLGLSDNEIALLMQCGLFVAGVSTILQSMGVFNIGAKLPIAMVGSFIFISPAIALGTNPSIGISGMLGSMMIGSLILSILGPMIIDKLQPLFTPTVTGCVVISVGMTIFGAAFTNIAGGYGVSDFGAIRYILLGVATMIIVLAINQFGKGFVKSVAVVIAITIGYFVATFMGIMDFSSVLEAKILEFPQPLRFGLSFNLGGIITVCVLHLVTMMEFMGDMTGVTGITENRLPTKDELKTGIRCDGVAGAFSALFNGIPVVSGSANVGILALSGVGSRFVVALCGLLLTIISFFPKFSAMLVLMPPPVLGGALLVILGLITSGGIKILRLDEVSDRNSMIIAMALIIGVGGHYAQDALVMLPPFVVTLCTGISGTALTALILNIVLPRPSATEIPISGRVVNENIRE